MINKQLLQPKSIVVIGGSNNVHKPGGSIVRNLINGDYQGELRIVNPKEDNIQGIKAFHDVKDIPQTDLAILVVAAKYCPDYVDYLCAEKGVRAFVIISAGFGEETKAGAALEQHILDTCERYGAALIGPNCIGLLNRHHHSVFTLPIPKLDPNGADFISGSGATAVFILESAVVKGLQFNSVWSIGNGKQIGIEDVLQYMDEHFNPETDSKVKLLYIENISNPDKLLYYASRLIQKGCRIAAIKSGSSESGSRAASSHTGAIASSDAAVEALFRKAGIVRCFSREELTTTGCIFMVTSHLKTPLSSLNNFAIVTHAGGPGVMLTDALSKGGLNVPKIEGPMADELKAQLFPGSSVANPIDFLATGTPAQLGTIIDYCEHKLDQIDAIAVIYGTPGLTQLYEAYSILDQKIRECKKPIFPILPSMVTAGPEVADFLAKGHVNFSDEVTLASTLSQIMRTPQPATHEVELYGVNISQLHSILFREIGRLKFEGKDSGWLSPNAVRDILTCAGIQMVPEKVSHSKEELTDFAARIGYPVVAKVVGPIHKSDVGGVALNIRTAEHLALEFDRMMQIEGATDVMVQKMLKGTELFIGAKYEERFGHVVLCGLGGIFVEVLKDVSSGLAPLTYPEAYSMIHSLRGYKIIKGTRGQKGVNEQKYAEIIVRLSTLLRFATEIKEIDINPLLADEHSVTAVDARIRIG
ncbi:MAG: acetate--CoA ligase family protein [Prevotella sp.]|nr:acetate--CoA ligase family protein [Prevotella sp.]